MKLSSVNPMNRYEYKLARENRRLAQIDLRKAEVERLSERGTADMLMARTIATRIMWAIITIAVCFTIGSINDVFQNHDNQAQITACEKALTQTDINVADCASGKIGAVKK